MDIVVKINDEDVTSWVYDLTTIPIYGRNYDFSQVFTDMTFTLSYKYKKHGLIKEKETVVEVFLDDNCVFTGYIESVSISGYYKKKIKVQHVAQKLKEMKALKEVRGLDGVILRPEFIFESETITTAALLNAIMQTLGFNINIDANYINESGELTEILESNEILNNIEFWDQEMLYNDSTEEVYFWSDTAEAPTLWDLLILLQKTFHFSCRFESVFSTNKRVNIITAGHFWTDKFEDLPAQAGVDPTFTGLSNKITIVSNSLLSDIPTRKAVKRESDSIENKYIDITLYDNPSTSTEEPETIETAKKYELIKLKENKIEYPEHFVFIKNAEPNMENIPLALRTTFIPLLEKFLVSPSVISIYDRWMRPQDYSDIGIYQAGFEKAAINYLEAKYYLPEWNDQILTKLPRSIVYKPKNRVFEIKQDEPERF